MKYEIFKESMVKKLSELLTDLQLEVNEVLKVNQSLDGISIIKGTENVKAGPTIYVQDLYRFYTDAVKEDFNETVKYAVSIFLRGLMDLTGHTVEFDTIETSMKDKPIIPQVINAEKNAKLLANIPHRMIEGLDLAIIYRLVVNINGNGHASTIVTNEIADSFEKTEEELFDESNDTFTTIFPCKIENIAEDFHAVTNERHFFGAYYGFNKDVLYMVSSKMNSDLYILPSTVHECFVLPADSYDKEEVKNTIISANTSITMEDEFLSNNLYMYLRNENMIVIV